MQLGKKTVIICISILFIAGCSSSERKKIPQTENPVLNKLLKSAEITTINLDEIPVDTVLAREGNIFGKTHVSSLTSPAALDRPVDLAKIGDSLYVADAGQ